MKLRLRTAWLEIAAGFHLLFAAVAAYALRDGIGPFAHPGLPQGLLVTLMLLAACAVFLLHPSQASLRIRRCLFFFAGAASAIGAAWFLTAGYFGIAALQIGYAVWLLGAAFFSRLDQRISATDEIRPRGLDLICGTALAIIGAHGFLGGAAASWHASLAAAWSIVAGTSIVWIEARGATRGRLAATLLGAMAFLYYGFMALADRDFGSGGAMIAVFVMFLLSVTVDGRLPEAADDLSGTTPRQREMYAYGRVGEVTLWAIAAAAAVFSNFLDDVDLRLFFSFFIAFAVITQSGFRLRLASAISERRCFLTLIALVASSIVLISATGGALGPFVYVAYLAVVVGPVIKPGWSIAVAAMYAVYVIVELGRRAILDPAELAEGQAAQYLFLATTVMCTGLCVAWIGRRRADTDSALFAANRRLAEALRNAVRERERYERQAQDLKGLNENLLEMRSALMNVLEDVEESKRQIEIERRREIASFNALTEGVLAADKDGRIFLCNPTAARILGVSAEAVIGQPIERVLRLFQEEDAVMQTRAFEEGYAGRVATFGERLRLTRADGSYVPVSGNVAPYLDEENRTTGIVAAFRDVTVEREIDRQKSDFISIASHQLRTPLSAMRWLMDLLRSGDAGSLKPTQKEYLEDMYVSVTRMVKLVGDLLNITRIESGKTRPNPEYIDTRAFVDSMVHEFVPLVRQQGLTLTSSVAKDATTFYADSNLVRQAISNVISNAVKYTPAGGSVSLNVKVAGAETVFKVKDTGVGIPKGQQYRIFDKFFRGENVVAIETTGSGLGLHVVKTIVELSNGSVRFESEEKKGSTFFLAFPNGPQALPAEIPRSKT